MTETNYEEDIYYESWLTRNKPYIILYGGLLFIIMFIIFPWIVGAINILKWIL